MRKAVYLTAKIIETVMHDKSIRVYSHDCTKSYYSIKINIQSVFSNSLIIHTENTKEINV